jgi:tRNA(fMet)-specific endonuclease VapC
VILLGTDTCVEVLRGNAKVKRRLSEHPGEAAVSFMTMGELFYGAANSRDPDRNSLLVEKFLLAYPVLHSEPSILRRFGELKAGLQEGKAMPPDADILIAATALEKAEALVTGNAKHFSRFPDLRLENWIR